jgi:hypothetical protein
MKSKFKAKEPNGIVVVLKTYQQEPDGIVMVLKST